MSIESKEINDIYALYQNIHERTYAEVKAEREEKKKNIKDPFRNTTIEKEDGTKLKRGDEGFDKELDKGRDAVTNTNNKSLGKDNNSSSSSSTSSNAKGNPIGSSDEKKPTASGSVEVDGKKLMNKLKSDSSTTKKIPGEFPGTKKEFDAKYGSDKKVTPPAPKLDRESGTPPNRTAPKLDRDEVKSDVGSDGLSSKNKNTKTVDVRNRRGRVTGTKEVRVQSVSYTHLTLPTIYSV